MRSLSLGAAVLLAIALAGGPRAALAQPAPPAAEPAIVPPHPLTPLHADYPADAQGSAVVVLALTINADGSVRKATVMGGDEPFASAAVAASSGWRFEPARRGDTPIAAVIRAQIRFAAPVAAEPELAPPPAASPGQPGAPPPPPAPIEVTVRGEQIAPGVTSMSRAEVRLLPGAFGDPFRALETLPGVTPLASGVPFFYVRGAPPGNVGYFLDGIRVPLLYHIGLGPSVIHPAIVDRVDLYPGGYPAQYGRFAGGIVSGETKPPGTEWHGEGNIRLVDAGAMVEGPFAGDKGSLMVAGRYSYTGLLLTLISSNLELQYGDYQARVSFRPSPKEEITVFAFGAYDYLGQKEDKQPTTTLFDTTFHRVDLRYDRRIGDSPEDKLRQAVTFGYDQTGFNKASFVSDHILASRTEIQKRLGERVLLRAGLDGQLDVYQSSLKAAFSDSKEFTSLFGDRVDLAMGARADLVIQVTPRLEVTPGVRVDIFESQGNLAIAVDPRLATRLAVTRDVRLVETTGLASQAPSFVLPGPGFQPSLKGGLQRSFQVASGVEVDFPLEITASATVFHNAFFNMTDPLGVASIPTGPDNFPKTFDRRSLGSSTGLEIMARRRLTKKLGGFLSYTLSRSQRYIDRSSIPSAFDRTHVLNAAASYDFGRGYRAGARTLFYTGYPAVGEVGGGTAGTGPSRLPAFFRLDLRFEKRWELKRRWWISFVAEVLNTTLSKETLQQDCSSGTCQPVTIGPVTIPSIGVEAGF